MGCYKYECDVNVSLDSEVAMDLVMGASPLLYVVYLIAPHNAELQQVHHTSDRDFFPRELLWLLRKMNSAKLLGGC